jgi:hypothetical protein
MAGPRSRRDWGALPRQPPVPPWPIRSPLARSWRGVAAHRRCRVAQLIGSGAVNAGDGQGGRGAAAAAARSVVLVRYRPGVVGETARTVHLVPLPPDERAGAVGAWCGAALMLHDIETVTPGEGMPCTVCVITHATSTTPTGEPSTEGPDTVGVAGLAAGGVCYQEWGWPVTLHRDRVRLSLHHDVSALAIPVQLCTEVTGVLTRRRCMPPVMVHPDMPGHRIVLTGERYGVRLPWPAGVRRITGVLLLPPTVTPLGPITWARPPGVDSLRLCREIDLFGALRTALNDGRPGDRPAGGEAPT